MSCSCGCCAGIEVLTPLPVGNRPGQRALAYRVGTHAAFLTTMLARLSGAESSALARLGTREPGDPAIALLDAWATIGEVLSFYQERIAQEGYLRTAAERRSLLELARLVGYAPRPGVSASAHLAFTLESGQAATVPAGTRAQSVPGPGELPQPFETSDALAARAEWNVLVPRQTQPQRITLGDVTLIDTVYFQGTATNLQPNDPLLFVFGDADKAQELRFVKSVTPEPAAQRTAVTLQSGVDPALFAKLRGLVKSFARRAGFKGTPMAGRLAKLQALIQGEPTAAAVEEVRSITAELEATPASAPKPYRNAAAAWLKSEGEVMARRGEASAQSDWTETGIDDLLAALAVRPSVPPASPLRLARRPAEVLSVDADAAAGLIAALRPQVRPLLYAALGKVVLTRPPEVAVYALRVQAPLFGHSASERAYQVADERLVIQPRGWMFRDSPLPEPVGAAVDLDGSYPQILPESWIVVQTPQAPNGLTVRQTLVAKAVDPKIVSRAGYGISASVTRVVLKSPAGGTVKWLQEDRVDADKDDFSEIRETRVFAQSELLNLSEQPILSQVCGSRLELGSLYDGVEAGRLLIVAGERVDVPGVSGLQDAELVMVAGVVQDGSRNDQGLLAGEQRHTTLMLANAGLAHCYDRTTVAIYGNVVHSTHGETRREALGSGDASRTFQEFSLRQAPLTFVSAATPDGAASTLQVRVDDLLWHEAAGLGWLGPRDRDYVTRTDEKDTTFVRFGDGIHGLRTPTGVENVRAQYRNGIGKPGNVAAGRISQLATRPLGVKSVVNPLRSSGGANADGLDQTRRNVPLATSPLDRLVSVEDYAEFARRFAGIGKASAARLSDGHAQVVQVTIAGADDIPIDETSDLFRNLGAALREFGDPHQRVQLVPREALLLVVSAGVKLLPDYEWESVEPRIRDGLLLTLGFDRRALGQSAFLSEVIAAIQLTSGVAFVDVEVFDAIGEGRELEDIGRVASSLVRNEFIAALPDRRNRLPDADPERRLLPAQLAWLTPDVPDTLLLQVLP